MAATQRDDSRNGRQTRFSLLSKTGTIEALQRFWEKSYAGDYTGLIVLAVLEVFLKAVDEPFHQLFLLSDTRLQHPYAEIERVPVFWLFLYAGGIPLTVALLWTLAWKRDIHKAHVTVLGLAASLLLTSFITDVVKDAVGRPRPDLIARCSPGSSAPEDELVSVAICTETMHHLLHDGWRSFPSGHSSFAFAGLGWLSLFLASQTHLLHAHTSLLNVLLCIAPLLGAALIGVSRLEDYRHAVEDVVVGSALGLLVTYFNWRRFYPGLTERLCEEPFSAPSRSTSPKIGFRRVRDEEEGYSVADDDP